MELIIEKIRRLRIDRIIENTELTNEEKLLLLFINDKAVNDKPVIDLEQTKQTTNLDVKNILFELQIKGYAKLNKNRIEITYLHEEDKTLKELQREEATEEIEKLIDKKEFERKPLKEKVLFLLNNTNWTQRKIALVLKESQEKVHYHKRHLQGKGLLKK